MIETLHPSERPRERCLDSGASSLSLRECLALILGSGPRGVGCLGLASLILEHPGDGLASREEEIAFFASLEISGRDYLKTISGLGPAGQAKILAAFEIGRRYSLYRNHVYQTSRRPPRKKPKQIHDLVLSLAEQALQKIPTQKRAEPQEWLGFVPIHRSGDLGDLCVVERGTRTHVNVDPAELFARILVLRPRGLILFHNHPSGMLLPSPQDLDLTRRVTDILKQFGIEMLGHWIVSSEGEYWIRPS